MTARSHFARARHAQRRAIDRGLHVVHRDRVSREQRTDEPVPNEPHEVAARPRVHQRGSRDPDGIATAFTILDEQPRHQRIVDGLFTRHLAGHEPELALGRFPHERVGPDEDALAAIFVLADRDPVTSAHAATFAHDEVAIVPEHQRRIHARFAGHAPGAADPHVRRQIGRREKALREYTVRRGEHEGRVGRCRKRRLVETGVCEAGHE